MYKSHTPAIITIPPLALNSLHKAGKTYRVIVFSLLIYCPRTVFLQMQTQHLLMLLAKSTQLAKHGTALDVKNSKETQTAAAPQQGNWKEFQFDAPVVLLLYF